ncbi:MAG TPA: tetratricopeptide repeat protein [Candidatus Binatia bacterium]|nr:tetratricopeptide repeat protein [Candidatus Binatia bacterium]
MFGDGVNIASRLQDLAEPDTICISDVVYRDVAKKLTLGTVVSLGRPKLKNIAERFPVYALLHEKPQGFRQTVRVQCLKLKQWRRPLQVGAAVLVLAWAGGVTIRSFYLASPKEQPQTGTPTDSTSLPLPNKPSIVVLPFVNMSNDPEQEYFSDGITEDLTSDLSRISSLFVISRNTAFTYKGKAVKLSEVSRELGIRYVVEGSVRKAGEQVRITTQLIDATTDSHLWSDRYDRPIKDIFAIQDEIRQKIVLALKVRLAPEEQARFQTAPTNNLEAYDFYLRGFESLLGGIYKNEVSTQTRQMFEKAIELDPQYATAYAMLGDTYLLEWFFQWRQPQVQSLERAFALAQRAVALDDTLPLPHAILGLVYVWKKQHEQGLVEAKRAVTLDPNFAVGYAQLGNVLAFVGQPEEGVKALEQAMRLNPRYPDLDLFTLAFAYRVAGRYEEALALGKKFQARQPDYGPTHFHLAVCYAELDRLEEARAEGAEILRLNPNFSVERFKNFWPMKDTAVMESTLAALRKAGLK